MNRKCLKVLGYRKQRKLKKSLFIMEFSCGDISKSLPYLREYLFVFPTKYSVSKQCCYSNWSTYCDERKFFFYKNDIQQRRCETHVYEHNQKHFEEK